MMMKDGPCYTFLLHLKLSSPHHALVFIKQLLCIKVPFFTSCASSLFFSILDKFFLFWLVFYYYTLLHSKFSSLCHTPLITNVSWHKSCLNFLLVWLLEKFSFFLVNILVLSIIVHKVVFISLLFALLCPSETFSIFLVDYLLLHILICIRALITWLCVPRLSSLIAFTCKIVHHSSFPPFFCLFCFV